MLSECRGGERLGAAAEEAFHLLSVRPSIAREKRIDLARVLLLLSLVLVLDLPTISVGKELGDQREVGAVLAQRGKEPLRLLWAPWHRLGTVEVRGRSDTHARLLLHRRSEILGLDRLRGHMK